MKHRRERYTKLERAFITWDQAHSVSSDLSCHTLQSVKYEEIGACSKSPCWRFWRSGLSGKVPIYKSCVSLDLHFQVIGHPFDTVKVRIQTMKTCQGGGNGHHYTNARDCLVKIVRNEGASTLFKGMSVLAVSSVPRLEWSHFPEFERNKLQVRLDVLRQQLGQTVVHGARGERCQAQTHSDGRSVLPAGDSPHSHG